MQIWVLLDGLIMLYCVWKNQLNRDIFWYMATWMILFKLYVIFFNYLPCTHMDILLLEMDSVALIGYKKMHCNKD